MTPTLSTQRLALRHLTRASQRQVDWLTDPEVVRYSEQRHQRHSLQTQLRYLTTFVGHVWAIFDVASGAHIGNLTACHDDPNNVSEVGILIGDKKFWGNGYGKEAWLRACEWLLDGGAVRKLEAGCMQTNQAMLKILRGSHFKQEGILANHFLVDDAPVSAVLFGRSR